MAEFEPEDYPKVIAAHFLMAALLAAGFVLGFHFSGDERGDEKTPYFFSAMVLAAFHYFGILFSLYIVVSTRNQEVFSRKNTSIVKTIVWYNIILNIALIYAIIGTCITFVLGMCKNKTKCYVQTDQELNMGIAGYIAAMHILSILVCIYLNGRIRQIRAPAPIKKPQPRPAVRIRIESDTSDSSDDEKKKKKKWETDKKKEMNNSPSVNFEPKDKVGPNPFGVLAKTVVKFMQARKKAGTVHATQQSSNNVPPGPGNAANKQVELVPPRKKLVRRSMSSPQVQPSRGPPPPPAYENVIRIDRKQKRMPDQDMYNPNPYHLPPLPHDGRYQGAPDNLYSGSAYPGTEPTVVHPEQAKHPPRKNKRVVML